MIPNNLVDLPPGERLRSPSAERRRLATLIGIAQAIDDGLQGHPFYWGSGEAMSKRRALTQLGVTLVTATRLKKLGHELVARSHPVGSMYFGSPIQKHCDVYVLGVQTRAKAGKGAAGATANDTE